MLSSTTADPELPLHAVPGMPRSCMQQMLQKNTCCSVGVLAPLYKVGLLKSYFNSPTLGRMLGIDVKLQCDQAHVKPHCMWKLTKAQGPLPACCLDSTTMAAAMQQGRPRGGVRLSALHVQALPEAAASPACRAGPLMRRPGPPCAVGPPPSPSAPSPARGPPARWEGSHTAASNHPVLC